MKILSTNFLSTDVSYIYQACNCSLILKPLQCMELLGFAQDLARIGVLNIGKPSLNN